MRILRFIRIGGISPRRTASLALARQIPREAAVSPIRKRRCCHDASDGPCPDARHPFGVRVLHWPAHQPNETPDMDQAHRTRLAHPIAQLSSHIRSDRADGLDEFRSVNWSNGTTQDSVDRLARSLKVATRVRIPLGLRWGCFNFWSGVLRTRCRDQFRAQHPVFPAPGGGAGWSAAISEGEGCPWACRPLPLTG